MNYKFRWKIFWEHKILEYKRWKGANPNNKFISFFGILIVILIILMIFIQIINTTLLPSILTLAEARVEGVIMSISNEKIKETLKDIEITNLIALQSGENSKVTALQANILEMNKLSFKIANAIEDEVNKSGPIYIKVALGNMFNNSLLVNRGPKISVKILATGTVLTDFKTEFETAGINQTRHKIYLEIIANGLIVLPFTKKTIKVVINIPVSETVIVGEVPDGFVEFNNQLKGLTENNQ